MTNIEHWDAPDDEPHSVDYDAGWNAAVKQAMPVIERLEAKVARLATTQGAVEALQALVPYLTRGGVPISGPDARAMRQIVGDALANLGGQ